MVNEIQEIHLTISVKYISIPDLDLSHLSQEKSLLPNQTAVQIQDFTERSKATSKKNPRNPRNGPTNIEIRQEKSILKSGQYLFQIGRMFQLFQENAPSMKFVHLSLRNLILSYEGKSFKKQDLDSDRNDIIQFGNGSNK